MLLKYASDSNCKWMFRIGINPSTYITQHHLGVKSLYKNKNAVGSPTGGVNLETDQLCKMIDPKFMINVAQDIFRQLTQMLYTHHSIARIHRSKLHAEDAS